MTVFSDEADRLLGALKLTKSPGWETAPTLQAHLRREHSKRGGEYILQNAERLGIPLNLGNMRIPPQTSHPFPSKPCH